MDEHDALVVVDVQRDFCPGGALAVPEGDQVVPVINRLVPRFRHIIYTRDWHPPDHISFSAQPEFRDGSWPPHAMENSPGAEWFPGLMVPDHALVVSKGTDASRETYSAFQAKDLDLATLLKERQVQRVFITGLATDYCVRWTALDAKKAGFTVYVVEDAVRGVAPKSTDQAWKDLAAAGVLRVHSVDLEAADKLPGPPLTTPPATSTAGIYKQEGENL